MNRALGGRHTECAGYLGGRRIRESSTTRMTIMTTPVTYLISLALLAAPPAEQKQDTLESIERTRGARHWIDATMDPPKSPGDALDCLQTEPGLRIELVAAEPLVMDPVAIAFDRRGRMFVVEYGDYPTGPEEEGPSLSRVVLLEDTNADGRVDRRHVFADRLTFAHSLMAWNDGILVGAQTEIIFLKDTTGDNQADVRQVLFKGFTPAHPQMQIGNPRWGFDNWIYLNYGPGRITSSKSPDKVVDMARMDFRFHPVTHQFEADSGLGQFGNTVDNWGHRFFCTNRNPIMMTVLKPTEVRRNPYHVIPKAYTDVGASGGATRVYPLVEMRSNWLAHAGTHTSACGTTAYRGDLLGEAYADNVFVCEPVGHLVTRSIIKPLGSILTAERGRPKADFIASNDRWFRPASLATGPDGALYLADMYRLHVEHPKFLPDEIAQRLDWRAGEDRGRVYRIVRNGAKPRAFEPPETTDDLVALLSDSNGWRRHLGQRLLVERQAKEAGPQLAELLGQAASPYTRLHALWTLDGLGALRPDHLETAIADTDPHVRCDAVSLATSSLGQAPQLQRSMAKLAQDKDRRVKLQVALAMSQAAEPLATKLLADIAKTDGHDSWMALAILSSAKERSGAILQEVADHDDPRHIGLIRQLAGSVGARGERAELIQLLNQIGDESQLGAWWQTAALSGLASGLPRYRGDLGSLSLAKLMANPPEGFSPAVDRVRRLLNRIQDVAVDSQRSVDDRAAAIKLLAHRPFDEAVVAFRQLLSSGEAVRIQLACLDAMGASRRSGEIVMERWPTLGPTVRGPALTLLLRRTDTSTQALEAMAAGAINPAVIGLDQRVRLLKHGDEKLRTLATQLFGGAVSPNRREVAQQYVPALSLEGSVLAGAKVFAKSCAKCHKLDGQGHEVGPDISDVRNRSHEALLYDILDPNRKLEPRYTDYSVLTEDGRVLNGLMVSETAAAVILRQAEGKQEVIARNQIDEIRASGKSLMPEGVEKEVNVQQMADLLKFLKSRGQPVSGG